MLSLTQQSLTAQKTFENNVETSAENVNHNTLTCFLNILCGCASQRSFENIFKSP